ncbi:hypothetical protein AN478_09570 [Thiohalorhabdus denitrificans]|uniref:Transmembrane protein n=1 Tax=Thiohalorhabdus denitrificans TaxID=381306 RepID=A0A0P9CRX6_9GAMM|nr:hypothetical protein [Thiohalorhabdus denitrificans]KPV39417.1 hypothetical protein AN478_09570 [Thiohalorhabdus denitrificans]SCY03902.1 hypothetical protein SAMN05661077_1125 [Thiohalorhabdus denitrificans]
MTRSTRNWLAAGIGMWALLALSPVRTGLEATLAGHMAAQLPLLVAAGWWLGRGLGPVRADELAGFNRHGAPGVLLAAFTLAFWLLPRSLDAALQEPAWEVAKFLALPLLAGVPLGRSWPRLPGLARAALWANLIPMLGVMGWLYIQSPVRLCNSYLIDQQDLLGWVLLGITGMLALYWVGWAFFGGLGRAVATDRAR